MTLRADIEATITAAVNPQEAAIDVCVLLESMLDLDGNGWFDDDERFREDFLGPRMRVLMAKRVYKLLAEASSSGGGGEDAESDDTHIEPQG